MHARWHPAEQQCRLQLRYWDVYNLGTVNQF